MKLLFVCLGNICRSPLADGIMRELATRGELNWTIDSAGTGDWHAGEPPDARAIAVAAHYGVDISPLRARQFTVDDFDRFDRIYPLDVKNVRDVLRLARNDGDRKRVELFLAAAFPGRDEGVRDPWYGDELFEPVYQEIREGCEALLKRLIDGGNVSDV